MERARRLELVWKEAHAVVARCQADYDRLDLKASVLSQSGNGQPKLLEALEAEKAKKMERLVHAQELERVAHEKLDFIVDPSKSKAKALD